MNYKSDFPLAVLDFRQAITAREDKDETAGIC